jgi:hypothetical protein
MATTTTIRVPQLGQYGVNKDLSQHELPANVWTDAKNIRFLDGACSQVLGYSELYPGAPVVPLHIMPLSLGGARAWIYASGKKLYNVINGPTHLNITRQTNGVDVDYNATTNSWTSCLIGGIPVLNNGVDTPQQWLLTGKAGPLSAWPSNCTAQVIRTFKNSLVALNITKNGVNFPFMIKWSHPADPGSVPVTWDIADATKDAGENDLSDGYDKIVDGLGLRGSFMIYKESSIWRMDYTGGVYIYSFTKVLGASGALGKNCIVELDGQHFVLSSSDCMIHDGQSATSVLDKQTRRFLFRQINPAYSDKCFVFVNRLYNEVFVCYPSLNSEVCDKAMVWNFSDKTISFRDMPNLTHASNGAIDDTSGATWASETATWDSETSLWDSNFSSLTRSMSVLASADQKLYLLDSGATFDGVVPSAYLERVGLSMGTPEGVKLVKSIRPRIYGPEGSTVLVSVGSSTDPYATPTYNAPVEFTIGATVNVDSFCSGRYIAIKFETGTAQMWRLDSYDIDVSVGGVW